ncbi:helix-turn-helix domain-containing protein [Mariniblastus sp.]|nr:helix-turn-helix domain-containing protein [Mariniblastus sp.]
MRLEPEDLAAIAEAVVQKLQLSPHGSRTISESSNRLGYTEAEASKLLGVRGHVLRDARRRGEISARKIGKRWIYSYETLASHLQSEL